MGQTGADLGGILGAQDAGVTTGGWAPRGWKTEHGADLSLEARGLREHHHAGYSARTTANVIDSDGTLLLGDLGSTGSALTLKTCQREGRPWYVVPWPLPSNVEQAKRQQLALEHIAGTKEWIGKHRIRVLNVAGNRESRNPGIGAATRAFVATILS